MKTIYSYEQGGNSVRLAYIGEDYALPEYQIRQSLTKSEQRILSNIRNTARKREWLGVRAVILQQLGYYPGIIYNDAGKPILQDDKKVSLSHSGKYVAVALTKMYVPGIDIEIVRSKIERLAHKFTFPENLNIQDEDERNRYLCAIWSSKETLYKIYSKGELDFKKHLSVGIDDLKKENRIKGTINIGNVSESTELSCKFIQHKGIELVLTYGFARQ